MLRTTKVEWVVDARTVPRSRTNPQYNQETLPASLARFDIGKLIALGRKHKCAITCSEAVWWRCHRRIISDYLLMHGETVLHLMGHDRTETANLTERAFIRPPGLITHPAMARPS